MRDLYEVQRLLLERRLPPQYFDLFPALAQVLDSTQLTVRRCENSIIYVKDWTAHQAWTLDFKPIEERRRNMLSEDHPCKLLQPIIAGEGSESGSDGVD